MRQEHETRFEGRHLRVKVCGRWEYVERTTARAGVVIVAVTADRKLLLVEQFRIPVQARVLELPAGLAGDLEDPHEEFLLAARRELLEETGYEASDWSELGGGPPSAGLSNETVFFFRARNLRKVAKGGGEGSENIHLHEIAIDKVPAWLQARVHDGFQVDPKIFAGLYFLQQEQHKP